MNIKEVTEWYAELKLVIVIYIKLKWYLIVNRKNQPKRWMKKVNTIIKWDCNIFNCSVYINTLSNSVFVSYLSVFHSVPDDAEAYDNDDDTPKWSANAFIL